MAIAAYQTPRLLLQGDKSIRKHKGFIKHFVYFTTVYETLKNVLLFKLFLLNELIHEILVLITYMRSSGHIKSKKCCTKVDAIL